MYEIIIDDARINIEGAIEPDKPVIFAVHGAGGGAWLWRKMRVAFGGNASLLAIDLPDHCSSGGKGSSSITEYREVVRKVVRKMGLDKPIAMGHSMGGAIVIDWALNNPEELSGLVLVGTGARLRVASGIFQAVKENFEGYIQAMEKIAFGKDTSPEVLKEASNYFRLVNPETIFGDFTACDKFDVIKEISKITLPTLILCGGADMLTPPKYSDFLAKNISRSDLVVISGAGHTLSLEKPQEAADAITDWLKKLS